MKENNADLETRKSKIYLWISIVEVMIIVIITIIKAFAL